MEKVNVMDKAGAYAIQEYPELLGAAWEGELENIIGLPLKKLQKELLRYDLLPF
jgi:septum formation protein